jgi:hypothetical protein
MSNDVRIEKNDRARERKNEKEKEKEDKLHTQVLSLTTTQAWRLAPRCTDLGGPKKQSSSSSAPVCVHGFHQ